MHVTGAGRWLHHIEEMDISVSRAGSSQVIKATKSSFDMTIASAEPCRG
jgi:hypothetical protein